MKNYFKLLHFVRDYRKLFRLAVFFMLVTAIFESFQGALMTIMTDRIFTDKPILVPNKVPEFLHQAIHYLNAIKRQDLFKIFPFLVVGLICLRVLGQFAYDLLMNDISQRVMRDLRARLYATIQHLSLDYFSKKRTGELVSRITFDVQVIENAVSYAITDLFYQGFRILTSIAIVFTIHFKAALFIFILVPLIGLPMALIGRRLKKISRHSQEKMADINSLLLETISGVRVVKAFSMEKYETDRFKEKNHDFYRLKMKAQKRLLLMSPFSEFVGAIFGVVIVSVLGQQIIEDKVSFGILIYFFYAFMSIISPIKKLSNVHAITQQALAANERIYEVLEAKPSVSESPRAQQLSIFEKEIVLRDVDFAYDQESGMVLKNINLNIKKGELLAIVGPTGTGKSTLVNLIPRFYDPTSGDVYIDGINLKEVTFDSLRRQIGIVAQETILFNDSVKANIAYGHLSASMKDIEAAAQKAFAHSFVTKMPQGYNTIIGDRGFRLSGGEKQRIAIARAILRNPPILILDEATSQLDSESEKFVQEALDELMKKRTVICIAHRFSTILKADKIVVLDHGRIVGCGKHQKLLEECSLYQRLYQRQFSLEDA